MWGSAVQQVRASPSCSTAPRCSPRSSPTFQWLWKGPSRDLTQGGTLPGKATFRVCSGRLSLCSPCGRQPGRQGRPFCRCSRAVAGGSAQLVPACVSPPSPSTSAYAQTFLLPSVSLVQFTELGLCPLPAVCGGAGSLGVHIGASTALRCARFPGSGDSCLQLIFVLGTAVG